MCSILFSSKLPKADINYINEHLKYRGPDLTNFVTLNNHFYLHNLLSITGTFTPQPLIDNNEIAVLFNGEVYNYTTFGNYDNDTKCLIPLYKEFGIDFIKKLDGEYAIVLVDYILQHIIVTTDIHGTKPLFVSTTDGVGVATYPSALERLGFKNILKMPANTALIFSFDGKLIDRLIIKEYNLDQYKTNYNDFFESFSKAITKRAVSNIREKMFIGLSSGYDSGTLCCSLMKQNVPFKAYSVVGSENKNILDERWKRFGGQFELEITTITPQLRQIAHQHIVDKTCEWKYTVYSSRSSYSERFLSLVDDNGSNSLSHLCSLARRDNKKIMLETTGCDEIFSDYGHNGVSKYPHSNFGGLFPQDLKTIFPWPSVFSSTMESYLMKSEFVGGSYGLEVRYPFIDSIVVQEFLNLSCELKNSNYKAPLHEYLTINNFPFSPGEKIGF